MMKTKISPEEYGKILKNLDLSDIYIIETKAKISEVYKSQRIKLEVKDKNSFEIKKDKLNINSKYIFRGKGENQEKPFVEIVVIYQLDFIIKEGTEVTEDFLNIFEELSLGIIIWPYFREYIHNMIPRMNLPPLTLPMKKSFIN